MSYVKMNNPFEVINARLSNIENLLLDIKHGELNPHRPGDELLTIEQAADFLSLTKPTIYKMVSRGIIPSMKRSKRFYFSREDLTNYIKRGRRETKKQSYENLKIFYYCLCHRFLYWGRMVWQVLPFCNSGSTCRRCFEY